MFDFRRASFAAPAAARVSIRGLGGKRVQPALGQSKPYPPIPSDAPPEIKKKAEECRELYDKLYDAWQEYYDCYHGEETIPCEELEQAMRDADAQYKAMGCASPTSTPECAQAYDDWYDAWGEHHRVCVDRPYSERCAEIYYGTYWPAQGAYDRCLEELYALLNQWRPTRPATPTATQPQRPRPVAPRIPVTTPRVTSPAPMTPSVPASPRTLPPVQTPSLTPTSPQSMRTVPQIPTESAFVRPGLPTIQEGFPTATTMTEGVPGECPQGAFPAYPGGPCRGAVAPGTASLLPQAFGATPTESLSPAAISPAPTSFASMGRRIPVMNPGLI